MAAVVRPPQRAEITGLILAGGAGRRVGGADKGLLPYAGEPLVSHVARRLAPQVNSLLVSANRNAAVYRQWGEVVPDGPADAPTDEPYPGPLHGILAGLRAAPTPWLAVVPCDLPHVPLDVVAQLAAVSTDHGAFAATGDRHTLVCLLPVAQRDALAELLARQERRVTAWYRACNAVPVVFDDATAFANLNTLDDLSASPS